MVVTILAYANHNRQICVPRGRLIINSPYKEPKHYWRHDLMTREHTDQPEVMKSKKNSAGAPTRIETLILHMRGERVILDADLAELYDVQTRDLNKAVRRNLDRFPEDFMFQLTSEEFTNLKFHFGTSRWGGTRKLPHAFTEQGVSMLSSVLRSKRAVRVNIEIMRAFVRLRELLSTHKDLARKLEELEKKYDKQFAVVFEAIRQLMTPPEPSPKRRIGFGTEED